MMLIYQPYDPDFVERVRAGGPDANGQPAERTVSGGQGAPCRSCLRDIPAGAEMLVLAARPFPDLQPYAELGPIFLCAEPCQPWDAPGVPPVLMTSPDYLLKGYGADHRIVYGTGRITQAVEIANSAKVVLSDPRVAYVDVRSARSNCFLTRITERP